MLEKTHNILLNITERPEEGVNEFFRDNIYTCQKLKLDLSKWNSFKYNII